MLALEKKHPEVNYSLTQNAGGWGCLEGKHRAAGKMDENRDLKVAIFIGHVPLRQQRGN